MHRPRYRELNLPHTVAHGANDHDELFTIRDMLRFAVTRFSRAGLTYGQGTANALEEAVFLILEALRLPVPRLSDMGFEPTNLRDLDRKSVV